MGAEFTDVDTDINTATISRTHPQVLAYFLPTMLLSLEREREGERERERERGREGGI